MGVYAVFGVQMLSLIQVPLPLLYLISTHYISSLLSISHQSQAFALSKDILNLL